MNGKPTGVFSHEEALDGLGMLLDADDLAAIGAALQAAAGAPRTHPLPGPVRGGALAAVELVAAALGEPATDLPDAAAAWVRGHRPTFVPALRDLARRALRRIALESAGAHDALATATLDDVLTRLGGAPLARPAPTVVAPPAAALDAPAPGASHPPVTANPRAGANAKVSDALVPETTPAPPAPHQLAFTFAWADTDTGADAPVADGPHAAVPSAPPRRSRRPRRQRPHMQPLPGLLDPE